MMSDLVQEHSASIPLFRFRVSQLRVNSASDFVGIPLFSRVSFLHFDLFYQYPLWLRYRFLPENLEGV
jgi:hypothetical protein